MTDRLTKFNEETGEYEYRERANTQAEFNAQRKAVIQRLGEFEDRAEGEWITHTHFYECSNCEFIYETDVIAFDYNPITDFDLHYCSVCGAKMKGADDEQR